MPIDPSLRLGGAAARSLERCEQGHPAKTNRWHEHRWQWVDGLLTCACGVDRGMVGPDEVGRWVPVCDGTVDDELLVTCPELKDHAGAAADDTQGCPVTPAWYDDLEAAGPTGTTTGRRTA